MARQNIQSSNACFSKEEIKRGKGNASFPGTSDRRGWALQTEQYVLRFQIAGDMGDTKAEAGGGKGEAMTVGVLVINNAVRRTVLEV
ncbi:hypothetical protein PABG_11194 [Paracoccidioides brasiliensis Pb03]|nr:hypothetical protein PABG_11194 [Paracoccidioides brasiliensis Pb03]